MKGAFALVGLVIAATLTPQPSEAMCVASDRMACSPDRSYEHVQDRPAVREEGVAPKGPLNTLKDISNAMRGCWKWPPDSEISAGMDLTVLLSFKRNGEIFGAKITYQSKNVSAEERAMYHGILLDALRLCSPLPVSESLGHAIAGRPMLFRFHDTRRERKV
jgi:hypothetical protein